MPTLKIDLAQRTLAAPEGVVAVDPETRHLWKQVRIGRARADGQFEIVWQSEHSIAPAPFPFFMQHSKLATPAGSAP
jgi:urea transport system substrate-binding protein